jgi:CRP/FNR family transcriptional regulator, cyclic AMP receptor protein
MTMQTMRETTTKVQRPGEFFNKLSPAALRDLESMEFPTLYQPGVLLFSEKSTPAGIFIVISGEVKLSINSSDGKRLILSIAKAGEVLGLSSVLSGMPSEMTAEVLYPSRIAVIERDQFLNFMTRHPEVYQVVTQELSLQYKVACEQLRTVALAGSAPEKLARLLLDWSENGQKTENGMRFRFSLTHEEIGEFIGASRETVTRTL